MVLKSLNRVYADRKKWFQFIFVLLGNFFLIYLLRFLFRIHWLPELPLTNGINVSTIREWCTAIVFNNTNTFFIGWMVLVLLFNTATIFLYAKYYNKKKEILLAFFVFILAVVLSEKVLRMNDFEPGRHTNIRYFTPVDTLKLLKGYYSDYNGIFKIDSFASLEIERNISSGNKNLEKSQINELYSLASENIGIINGEVNNEFSNLYKRITKKDTLTLSDLEKGIIEYVNCPINQDGFKSIPFKQYKSKKPKILLLGDSFTWGHSTSHKSYSFADQLLAKEYVVYNASITATDVAQYLAVAKKYIPLLQPDFVIVNFYLGNDITYYKRESLPTAPVFFYTNAGVLMACPHGKYFENAGSAYNFYLNQWSIPENDNIINKLMSKNVLTTLCWRLLLKLEVINYGKSNVAVYYQNAEKRKYSFPYCNVELQEIKKISSENGAKFILSSIPEVYKHLFNTKKEFPDLFEGLEYVEMNVSKSDYKLDDGHFNNFGHRRYAEFLIKQIEAEN